MDATCVGRNRNRCQRKIPEPSTWSPLQARSVAGFEHGDGQLRRQLEPDVRSTSFQRDRPMLAAANTGRAKRELALESGGQVDEALWAAYQRYDKRAVTKELLQRYLRPRKGRPRQPTLSHG